MNPGVMNLPAASIRRLPGGISMEFRRPTATMCSPLINTTASVTDGPPLPSINVAPTIAIEACPSAVGSAADISQRSQLQFTPDNLARSNAPFDGQLVRFRSYHWRTGSEY